MREGTESFPLECVMLKKYFFGTGPILFEMNRNNKYDAHRSPGWLEQIPMLCSD